MNALAISPVRRAFALGGSAALGMLLLIGARGSVSAWGLLLHLDPSAAWRDVAAFLIAALAVGIAAPLIAGDYISGLPARALCVAWAGVALAAQPGETTATAPAAGVWATMAFAELLTLAASVWITTTACWLVDTRITFPRLYPNPEDRPPSKHTSGRDILLIHAPNAVGLAIGVGAVYLLMPSGPDPTLTPFVVAFAAALVRHALQRRFPSRGSIWAMLGVIGGVALAILARAMQQGGPVTVVYDALPVPLLTCAAAGYATVLVGSRSRPAPTRS